jgi:Zn-dependent peptidase ImmA (M78 family)
MRLDDDEYEYIKQEVANMYVFYDIKDFPINVFEVADKIGLDVIPYSSLTDMAYKEAMKFSTDGFSIENLDNTWVIFYNDKSLVNGRIRQTIMHEIGHYILGHMNPNEKEEAEANFFAKYALASPIFIRSMNKPKSEENMMQDFKISRTAASNALKNYNQRFLYGPKEYTNYEKMIVMQFQLKVSTSLKGGG